MLNTDKLFKELARDENLKDVPVTNIVVVTIAVLDAIRRGNCMKGDPNELSEFIQHE